MVKDVTFLKRRIAIQILVIAYCFCIGCHSTCDQEVYDRYPKGTLLSLDLLRAASQFAFVGNDHLILVVDISNTPSIYSPYLLFFGPENKLVSSCYYASERIERIDQDTIFGYLNKYRAGRDKLKCDDLPGSMVVHLMDSEFGQIMKSNKVATKIDPCFTDMTLTLGTAISNDSFQGLQFLDHPISSLEIAQFFPQTIDIHCKIDEFQFDYKNSNIIRYSFSSQGHRVLDQIIVADQALLDSFYVSFLRFRGVALMHP